MNNVKSLLKMSKSEEFTRHADSLLPKKLELKLNTHHYKNVYFKKW